MIFQLQTDRTVEEGDADHRRPPHVAVGQITRFFFFLKIGRVIIADSGPRARK